MLASVQRLVLDCGCCMTRSCTCMDTAQLYHWRLHGAKLLFFFLSNSITTCCFETSDIIILTLIWLTFPLRFVLTFTDSVSVIRFVTLCDTLSRTWHISCHAKLDVAQLEWCKLNHTHPLSLHHHYASSGIMHLTSSNSIQMLKVNYPMNQTVNVYNSLTFPDYNYHEIIAKKIWIWGNIEKLFYCLLHLYWYVFYNIFICRAMGAAR